MFMKESHVQTSNPLRGELGRWDMKGQGRQKVCVEPGKDWFIYDCLEGEKEMENDGGGRGSGIGET